MNIFTNLLFLHGYIADPHLFDEDEERYSQTYGNRVASEKVFAPLGHAKSAQADNAPALDCAIGGCA